MKLYSLDEVKDKLIGKVGTPEKNEYERKVNEAMNIDKTKDLDVFDSFHTDWGGDGFLKILPKASVNQECLNVRYQSGSKIVAKEFLKM